MSTNNTNSRNTIRVVLFSTKMVGAKGTLFESTNSCTPFESAKLYECLISKEDSSLLDILGCKPQEKENAYKVFQEFIKDEKINNVLKEYNYKMPENYEDIKETVDVVVEEMPQKLQQWKIICQNYESAKDSKTLFEEKYEEEVINDVTKASKKELKVSVLKDSFSKIKDEINFDDKENKYNRFFNRFFLYKYEGNKFNNSFVYGIKKLDSEISRKKWLNALCDEITKRHSECIDFIMVLHDKDLGRNCHFCILDGEYMNSIANLTRTVVLFQHTPEDPMMKVITSPLQDEDIFETVCGIIRKKRYHDIYEKISDSIANNKKDSELREEAKDLPDDDEVKNAVGATPLNRISVLEIIEMKRRTLDQ